MSVRSADGKARGSAMSSKQLARTVVHGRKVSFQFPSGQVIEGYLCGMDDFHYMVVEPVTGQKHLIHKGGACIITLADESTYDVEPRFADLERVVAPFREYVDREYFGRQKASTASE